MQSGMVAVWDEDCEYAEKLSEYLRRQGGLGASVVSFRDRQRLLQAIEQGQVAVALAADTAQEEVWPQEIPTVYLTEDPAVSRASPGQLISPFLYKYQPARQILRVVSGMRERTVSQQMQAVEPVPGGAIASSPARIRGIYSPLGGCLKTSLGLVMGCLLAEERRCLFVSLEAHSGFRTLFGRQYPMDLADLLALVRQGGHLSGALTEAMQPFGKLYYIPPVIWPVDIREAEFAELKELLRHLAFCGRFDEIIVDVGQDLARPERILSMCDDIYQPEKEDIFSQAKLAEYDCYLRISGYERLSEKVKRIPIDRLSDGKEARSLDQWQRWEQMIPAVRRILEEAENERRQ